MVIEDENILLVEDNPDDIELAMRAFRKNKIANNVIVAHDGVEALDYLFCRGAHAGRNIKKTPRLILLDLKLPKIDGLQVLEQIRNNAATKLTPVVILTSSKEEQDLLQSYQTGANSYVRKPIDFNTFVEAVRNIGLYWLLINEPPPDKSKIC
jgi:two-component system response regulator